MMLPPVLNAVQAAGHKVFLTGKLNLNVVAIRSPGRTPDLFDDMMTITCRKRADGPFITHHWPITTDPGLRPLIQRKHPRGVAILCPGQYRSVYMIDKHGGKYDALCQRNGDVLVWRDNDGNNVLDMTGQQFTDARGINIHAADLDPYDPYDKSRSKVGLWSEGCMVFKNSEDFREFMALVRESAAIWGQQFTVTLIDEVQLKAAA